jgi:hypothetical protein
VGAIVLGGRNSRVGMAVSVGVEMPTGKPENGLGDGHFSGTTSLTLSVVPSTRWRVSLLLLDHLALGEPKVVDPSPERIPSPSATPQHLGSSPPVSNDPGALKPIAYGSVIGPHHAHELRARPSISYIWGPAYASVGAEVVGIVTEGGAWGPIALNAELGAYAIESVRVAFGGELAVGGEKRLPWQLSLRTEYLF